MVRKIVEKETGDEFAAKYVRKKRTKASRNGMSREDIKREIEILRLVDSEKIIKVHDVYETDKEMILVMELWVNCIVILTHFQISNSVLACDSSWMNV